MASGIAVNSECIEVFQGLKLKKKSNYILYKLNDGNTEIIVAESGHQEDYDKFVDDLPKEECRWAIYDFKYEKADGGQRNKIIFIAWAPDSASIKEKMVFASSRDALKRALTGIALEFQGSDETEIARDVVLDKANRSA